MDPILIIQELQVLITRMRIILEIASENHSIVYIDPLFEEICFILHYFV